MTERGEPRMAGSGDKQISSEEEPLNSNRKSLTKVTLQLNNDVLDSSNESDVNETRPYDNPMSEISPKTASDETDALPPNMRYNWFDLLCTLISVLTYVADVVMDCVVAYYFYHLGVEHGIYHYWYFGLTISFILVPSLTMTGFSFRWYVMDNDNSQLPKVGMFRWVVRLLALLFQVAPILRYLDSIKYGVMSRIAKCKERQATTDEEKAVHRQNRIKWYTLMIYEDADATLLRLYESFMESAPQLVLQIYILIKDPHANKISNSQIIDKGIDPFLKLTILIMSVTTSLVSLAWSLVTYHRSLRYTYPNKKNISLTGTVFQFLWHFCSITARVLALSLFASIFPKWIGPFCAAHWLVMSSWVVFQRTSACNTRCEEFLFSLVLGAIYIFSFFNAKEERTRYKYLLYYVFSFLENTALVAIWFWKAERGIWYLIPAVVGHYAAFFAGIFFMLAYYLWFHPTGIDISFMKFAKGDEERGSLERRPQELSLVSPIFLSPDCRPPATHTDGRPTTPLSRLSISTPELEELEHLGSVYTKSRPVRRSASEPTSRAVTDLLHARRLKYMGAKDSSQLPVRFEL